MTPAPAARSRVERHLCVVAFSDGKPDAPFPENALTMPSAIIDGIATRYEVTGAGPPLLMYAPAGFDATLDKWATQGVYAKTKLLAHLPAKYTCIIFDRRECGQSGGRVERVSWAHYVTQGKGLLDHLNIQ